MLTLTETRYWFFRFQTELAGGDAATGAPEGLKELYEESIPFQLTNGWAGFGVGWDISENDFGEKAILPINKSVWGVWKDALDEQIGELPAETPDRTIRTERPNVVEYLEIDAVLKRD